ncbi:MAG: zinc-binding dehydrogenase [Deltaproteobacteria bacterium]|nr:zinc-binding dehydrogenase [Deltaproteobacteria bacterium]MBW2594545.1 zinc-binding dehydrogenase [Deltaproteobacteria bacterium]MBW2649622.1 zinc-binding dehydrogenase [Deltaproteobacteria bacterium]
MTKMGRAAVMTAQKKDLEFIEYPLPEVEKGCILVKITCCTICGSDVHSWLGHRPAPVPIILGHEIVGKIVELGRGVTHDSADRSLRVGDRVTWTIMDNCGKCYYCRDKGLPMKCQNLKKYGHDSCETPPHFKGGFAEYCYITPGTCVFKVPDSLTDEEVAPANCALGTVIAAWEAAEVKPFENVLIQGAGALGFYASALASHYGCRKIIVTDILDHRLDFIKRFGATDTINVRNMKDDEIVDAIKSLTDDHGVDCAMEVAGVPGLIPLGLKCLRIGGRFVEVGCAFPGADFTYDACDIIFRRLTIRGIHNYDARHLKAGLDLLEMRQKDFPFREIVTHRISLDDINKGLRIAESGEAVRVAVIM